MLAANPIVFVASPRSQHGSDSLARGTPASEGDRRRAPKSLADDRLGVRLRRFTRTVERRGSDASRVRGTRNGGGRRTRASPAEIRPAGTHWDGRRTVRTVPRGGPVRGNVGAYAPFVAEHAVALALAAARASPRSCPGRRREASTPAGPAATVEAHRGDPRLRGDRPRDRGPPRRFRDPDRRPQSLRWRLGL